MTLSSGCIDCEAPREVERAWSAVFLENLKESEEIATEFGRRLHQ